MYWGYIAVPGAGESEYPLMPYNHEEFDTRVMLHAANAVSRGYKRILILEWTTSLDTSPRTSFVLEWTTSLDTSSRTLYWNGQLVWTPVAGIMSTH